MQTAVDSEVPILSLTEKEWSFDNNDKVLIYKKHRHFVNIWMILTNITTNSQPKEDQTNPCVIRLAF